MATNIIEVSRNQTETTANVVRRFTRKAKTLGFIQQVKGDRYYNRALSPLKKKARKLKGIENKAIRDEAIKMGKTVEK